MTATLTAIEEKISSGELEAAQKALASAGESAENKLEVAYLRGYLAEMNYDREEALAAYQEVIEADPGHRRAAFRAALVADALGDDDSALELYERCVDGEQTHTHALINLALIYEERRRYEDAERCLRHILEKHPEHCRARKLLKSVASSREMIIDDRRQQERHFRDTVLDTPISDFELSVRSRNCLRQMNIRTLGDLLRTTEAELLAYKNFGETSLNEIREMLSQKGLSLGQGSESATQVAAHHPVDDAVAAAMQIPVSSLDLSVRSRKCLQRLGITTLGELTQRSESELIATRNFGQTSLSEIKQAMESHGLHFRESH